MIRIQNVTKQFGALCAVDDLSLDVPRGELFCFLGPNGAGKTTTIKMLTGLMKPTRGTIEIGGVDIQADPVSVKRQVGYIPDVPYLYDRLTPVEFMEFTGDLYDVPRETVRRETDRSFEAFGMEEYRNVLIKDLSHGYRQRLIYAATFLHDPKVLFIDEPLVGLDPHTIRAIKDLLVASARRGMTIFFTTHILAVAEDIADRIGIILRGRLAALGTLDELSRRTGIHGRLEDIFLSLTEGNAAG
jgi:ABC-2 type transport system ATP-binding protein